MIEKKAVTIQADPEVLKLAAIVLREMSDKYSQDLEVFFRTKTSIFLNKEAIPKIKDGFREIMLEINTQVAIDTEYDVERYNREHEQK